MVAQRLVDDQFVNPGFQHGGGRREHGITAQDGTGGVLYLVRRCICLTAEDIGFKKMPDGVGLVRVFFQQAVLRSIAVERLLGGGLVLHGEHPALFQPISLGKRQRDFRTHPGFYKIIKYSRLIGV